MDKNEILSQLKFNKEGLIPVIIQDEKTKQVLMLAYMNKESLERTLVVGKTYFYSRSRRKLWLKGETSGNIQLVKSISLDCDNDTLLVLVKQKGAACHTGNYSCFFKEIKYETSSIFAKEQTKKTKLPEEVEEEEEERNSNQSKVDSEIINEIYRVIQDRKLNYQSDSYVCKLMSNSEDILPKKIGEEAVEVIIALKGRDKNAIIYEVADLWFHTLVALGNYNISPQDVFKELKKRRKT